VAIAEGLRQLHSLPVEGCPYDWSAESRVTTTGFHRTAPPIDRLVVYHGDACAPNTLLDAAGRFLAHVDF
jgi:kanamycin kinase